MLNRTATFASALVTSILASISLTTVSNGATPAADECLAGPKGAAPAGSHWYYRIEQLSKRHCWYVRGQQDARGQTAAPDASTSTTSVPTNAATAMPGSVANARAELSSSQPRDDHGSSALNGPSPASAANADTGSQANISDASLSGLSKSGPQTSVVASRWPDQLAANSTTVVADNSGDHVSTTTAAAAPAVPFAAVDATSDTKSGSTQMLIIAIVGALSVAGLAASAVGLSGKRKVRVSETQGGTESGRRAIWETTLADGPLASPFAAAAVVRPQIGIPNELREADDPDDRVADMLARLARSAQV